MNATFIPHKGPISSLRRGIALLILGSMMPAAHAYQIGQNPDARGINTAQIHPAEQFSLFLKAKKKTAALQLDYAQELRDAKLPKKAMKQFRALVKTWPMTKEAALAQYEYSKLYEQTGPAERVVEHYAYLLKRYPGLFPTGDVLSRLFNLADRLTHERKGKILLFKGVSAPERALTAYGYILSYAPQWKRAAEAQYRIGLIHQNLYQYEEALVAYERVAQKYAGSSWAEKGSFQRAACLMRLAKESPNDNAIAEQAWVEVSLFLQKFPAAEQRDEAKGFRDSLEVQRAKSAFEKAEFYERIAKRYTAAIRAYEKMIEQFPSSKWSSEAQARIAYLKEEQIN